MNDLIKLDAPEFTGIEQSKWLLFSLSFLLLKLPKKG